MSLVLVAVGGGLGAALRFLLGHLLDARPDAPSGRHRGTLVANLAGSFVLGLLLGNGVGEGVMSLWGVGFCGGLTTYSAFAVQAVEQPRRPAAAYVVLTLGGCLAAAWLGLHL